MPDDQRSLAALILNKTIPILYEKLSERVSEKPFESVSLLKSFISYVTSTNLVVVSANSKDNNLFLEGFRTAINSLRELVTLDPPHGQERKRVEEIDAVTNLMDLVQILKNMLDDLEKNVHVPIETKIKKKVAKVRGSSCPCEKIIGGYTYTGGSAAHNYLEQRIIQYELFRKEKGDLSNLTDRLDELTNYDSLIKKSGIDELLLSQIELFASLVKDHYPDYLEHSSLTLPDIVQISQRILEECDRRDYQVTLEELSQTIEEIEQIDTRDQLTETINTFRQLEKESGWEKRCQIKSTIAETISSLAEVTLPEDKPRPKLSQKLSKVEQFKELLKWEKAQLPKLEKQEKEFNKIAEQVGKLTESFRLLFSPNTCLQKPIRYIKYLLIGNLLPKIVERKGLATDILPNIKVEKLSPEDLDKKIKKLICSSFTY